MFLINFHESFKRLITYRLVLLTNTTIAKGPSACNCNLKEVIHAHKYIFHCNKVTVYIHYKYLVNKVPHEVKNNVH